MAVDVDNDFEKMFEICRLGIIIVPGMLCKQSVVLQNLDSVSVEFVTRVQCALKSHVRPH